MYFLRSPSLESKLKFLSKRTYTNPSHLTSNEVDGSKIKPFSSIPHEKGIRGTFLGLIIDGGPRYLHRRCERLHNKLGSIYNDKLGKLTITFISDPELIKKVCANEGKYPQLNVPEAWLLFASSNNIKRGVFFATGPEWQGMRKPLNKILLQDNKCQISNFDNIINDVNEDFFNTLPTHCSIPDLKKQLSKWSIETVGCMLFGQRIGCFEPNTSFETSKLADTLVDAVANVFNETSKFQILSPKLAQSFNLNVWKRFADASQATLDIAQRIVDDNISRIKSITDSKDKQPNLVEDILQVLTEDEARRSLIDLLIAADTTASSMQWILYCLGKYQKEQQILYDELKSVRKISSVDQSDERKYLSGKQVISSSYLKGFIKEVLRLYPSAPFLARTLDTNIELDGYEIPAKNPIIFSLIHTSRSAKYFDNPNQLVPERWKQTRQENSSESSGNELSGSLSSGTRRHPFALLPFGVGARSCLGKRLADLQLHLLTAAFVSRFKLSIKDSQQNLGVRLDMTLAPEEPIEILLSERHINPN